MPLQTCVFQQAVSSVKRSIASKIGLSKETQKSIATANEKFFPVELQDVPRCDSKNPKAYTPKIFTTKGCYCKTNDLQNIEKKMTKRVFYFMV